jgi:DNA-binding CsgD family transcriptional regulator
MKYFHLVSNSPREAGNFSPRECEVLELLAQGFIYKEISDQLNISIETVRTYVKTSA